MRFDVVQRIGRDSRAISRFYFFLKSTELWIGVKSDWKKVGNGKKCINNYRVSLAVADYVTLEKFVYNSNAILYINHYNVAICSQYKNENFMIKLIENRVELLQKE